jgi:hypothetical protein
MRIVQTRGQAKARVRDQQKAFSCRKHLAVRNTPVGAEMSNHLGLSGPSFLGSFVLNEVIIELSEGGNDAFHELAG